MHTHAHTHTHTHAHPQTCTHTHKHTHARAHAHTHTHTDLHTDVKPPIYTAVTRPDTEDPTAAVTANQVNPSYVPLEQLITSQAV